MGLTGGSHFRLSWLRETYQTLVEHSMYEVTIRIYMLHMVGCSILVVKSRVYIDARYISLFTELEHVCRACRCVALPGKEKSNTFNIFKELRQQLQREKGNGMVRIRSDYDKEFKNSKFSKFCSSERIDNKFSASITPQENGVVERKNMTL